MRKALEGKYPDVTTGYASTNQYSVQEHVRRLEQAIAPNPDGFAVPVVDCDADEGPLRKAFKPGIPVVAFNIPGGRGRRTRRGIHHTANLFAGQHRHKPHLHRDGLVVAPPPPRRPPAGGEQPWLLAAPSWLPIVQAPRAGCAPTG